MAVRIRSAVEAGREARLGAVFYVSLVLSIAFVVVGVAVPERLERGLEAVQDFVLDSVGPGYAVVVTGLVLFVLALAVLPVGRTRLGAPEERPEFGWWSWLAMLLSAGVGLSFLFWGMAEPLIHLVEPPYDASVAGSEEAARAGVRHSFLFWGVHAWATYAVVAIAVGYVSFRHDRPVLISSALRPLIGDHAPTASWARSSTSCRSLRSSSGSPPRPDSAPVSSTPDSPTSSTCRTPTERRP